MTALLASAAIAGLVAVGTPPPKPFSPMESGTTLSLIGVWGDSPRDVFVAGEQGTVLHHDGASWLPLPTETTQFLYAVWGAGDAVIAVGRGGTILRAAPLPSH